MVPADFGGYLHYLAGCAHPRLAYPFAEQSHLPGCFSDGIGRVLLNNLLPFRLGEFGRAFLLGRKSDLKFMGVLPSIVVERALDFTFAAFLLIISVPFVVGAASKGTIAIIIGSIMVLGLGAMYLLARNRLWALQTFDRFTGRWPRLQKQGDLLLALFLMGWLS